MSAARKLDGHIELSQLAACNRMLERLIAGSMAE